MMFPVSSRVIFNMDKKNQNYIAVAIDSQQSSPSQAQAKRMRELDEKKLLKYSRKFLAEHEADLELYRAAQAEMRSLLGGAKLPQMDVLKEEGRKLTAKKKQLYGEYQKARRDMQELVTIKANIDTLMGYTEPGRKQEKER